MPKRHLFIFTILAVALLCGSAFAQGVVPGPLGFREGVYNNMFPYNTSGSSRNMCYMQFHAPGEFCVNPPDPWNGGTYQSSGVLEPALLSGLSVRPDYRYSSVFTATHTRPDPGTFHFLTDLQANLNFIYYQDSLNWNASTVTYPGGFTLSFPTGDSGSIPGTQNFTPITSTVGAFTYLGTLTGCCGSCPSPAQGGLMINFRAVTGSGSSILVMDAAYTYYLVGATRHYNVMRFYAIGGGASGFCNTGWTFQGLAYQLAAGGCKTYSDLYDEVLNAVITGNPPSDRIPVGDAENPIKNDPGIGGIRNSLWKKAINSEAAYNRGRYNSAGNTLDAMTHHVDAQDGKHLDTDSAQDLRNCIRSLKSSLGL
jgi:hypothetical protein